MKFTLFPAAVICCFTGFIHTLSAGSDPQDKKALKQAFTNPDNAVRPQPFWHINGELTTDGIYRQIGDAFQKDGFGGVAILPLTPDKMWQTPDTCPGTTPDYLSEPYFDRYRDILECSAGLGTQVILYDDIDFPSGVVGGKMQRDYPQFVQKRLGKAEFEMQGPGLFAEEIPAGDQLLGAVAMHKTTHERIDISSFINGNRLEWMAPAGEWLIFSFFLEFNQDRRLDYMDPEAVNQFISMTYDQYACRFSDYFGNTIQKTFFDDVGYYDNERCWNQGVTKAFEAATGKKALLYYPALWYDIGPETAPARVAFYSARSGLLGETYPKQVAEWCEKQGLQSMGHPPGNYEPNTIDMYGDPFKFYRYTHVPLMDMIHGYPYGRPGYKLISSAADLFDRPEVAVEIYGNYPADMDSFMLYRGAMEAMLCGVNFFVPHGMWYDTSRVKIPPLVSHHNELLGPALPAYSDYVARSVTLLNKGARVADIALLFPIESLGAWLEFDNPDQPRIGKAVPPETDYNRISDMLTRQIRQDFTFLHPEQLVYGPYQISDGTIALQNQWIPQQYKLLIIPASRVLSAETLSRIQQFYESGGKVLATGLLPSKSAEFDADESVIEAVQAIFGIDPTQPMPVVKTENKNSSGGIALFIPQADKQELADAIDYLLPEPDVKFDFIGSLDEPDALSRPLAGVEQYRNLLPEQLGLLSYIHKQRNGLDIYLFANSTNVPVTTQVKLRGRLKPEQWNAHDGTTALWEGVTYETMPSGEVCTVLPLQLPPVSSLFAVAETAE